MMKAPVGFIWVVTGSSSAIVRAGPMPGKTPIAVPRTEPTNAHRRFSGVSATAKPWARAASVVMPRSAEPGQREARQRQPEEPREEQPARDAETEPEGQVEREPPG